MLCSLFFFFFFFFFQAEDGIRDTSVTGVQTCALPISVRFQKVVLHHVKRLAEIVQYELSTKILIIVEQFSNVIEERH